VVTSQNTVSETLVSGNFQILTFPQIYGYGFQDVILPFSMNVTGASYELPGGPKTSLGSPGVVSGEWTEQVPITAAAFGQSAYCEVSKPILWFDPDRPVTVTGVASGLSNPTQITSFKPFAPIEPLANNNQRISLTYSGAIGNGLARVTYHARQPNTALYVMLNQNVGRLRVWNWLGNQFGLGTPQYPPAGTNLYVSGTGGLGLIPGSEHTRYFTYRVRLGRPSPINPGVYTISDLSKTSTVQATIGACNVR
jgi:hypothetical protein